MSVKDVVKGFIAEGSRVAWTAIEAAAGILAAYTVSDSTFDFLGPYEPAAVLAVGTAVAAAATALKEAVRKHQAGE